MTIQAQLTTLISPLVSSRFYPDTPPDNPVFPYATFQQVGGDSRWKLEGGIAGKKTRIQINVWAATRVQADEIAAAIEKAIAESSLAAEAYGDFTGLYEPSIKKYGTRQDFGIWHNE